MGDGSNLIEAGLIDEYQVVTVPLVVVRGRSRASAWKRLRGW
jgi:hypothetical protein